MRTLLHKSEKGHLGQYEDWWYLVEENGAAHVEHEWDHVRVNGLGKSEGKEILTIEQALNAAPESAKSKLREKYGV